MTQNPFSRFPPEPALVNPQAEGGVPDPGSKGMGWLAGLIALVCFATVVFLNQFSGASSSTQKAAKAITSQRTVDLADPMTLASKMVVKLAHLFDTEDKAAREAWLAETKSPVTDPSKRSESERVREAIVHAEILKGEDGVKEAERLFKEMEEEFADRPDRLARHLEEDEQARIDAAKKDIETLRQIYKTDEAHSTPPTEEEKQRLIDRHEWFGNLALSFGKPDSDPERAQLLAGGGALIGGVVLIGAAGLIAAMGGMGCFVAMVVLISTGKIRRRFVAPAPGGSFGWEMIAAFLLTFLGFKLVVTLVGLAVVTKDGLPNWFAYIAIGGQWLVALAIFFPLLRGVRFGEYRKLAGWTAERGIIREIGAGIFGYLAGLPIVFCALLVSLLLNVLIQTWSGKDAEPPTNPILEIAGRGDALLLVLLFTLATIWAPIVEETVFRGGLFRAMRAHMHFVLAAIASALVFGFMHPYPIPLLGPVIAIGFVFALIREWRGSIIGPIVAHFLNNATILAILFLILTAAA
ncbi:MAG: CPBP family intramembrane metalloprotease [Phycisphaeraceae bacterium]|nr:CPBP family intramembrane metalloprotease [Phycisphaeraceae bacterium]